MATINLLKSSYNGKLGQTYGVQQYHKKFVKAIPFSHAPHNDKQQNSVRAFEKLNRVSAEIARKFFFNLPLSDKTLSRMNAVASFLKPVVKDNTFNLSNVKSVFGSYESFSVPFIQISTDANSVVVNVENLANENTYSNSSFFVGLFDLFGNCAGSEVIFANSFTAEIPLQYHSSHRVVALILRTVKRGNKKIPFFAFFYSFPFLLIENQTLLCDNFVYASDFNVLDKILYATTNNFINIENQTIFIEE